METKPTYSLKFKKLFKLDLNRNINPTMAGNLIWICETQKVTCTLFIGKVQGSKNIYFIVFAPVCYKGVHCLVMGKLK
jgi:hypothetical protein